MRNMRHVVSVMRPTKALSDRGQLQGKDETVIKEWPCSIEPLSGTKVDAARTLIPTATHRVTGRGNPDKRIANKDYMTGGSLGSQRLIIEHKADENLNEEKLTLICSEVQLG